MSVTRTDKTKTQLEVTADLAAAALLGTPAGASVSADIAAVKSDTAAIKTKTDNLPANTATTLGTPAGASLSADIAAIKVDTGAGATAAALATAKGVIDAIKVETDTLGSPAGASHAADAAAIKADTAAIKTKTDNLPANTGTVLGTPAGASIAADIAAVKADTGAGATAANLALAIAAAKRKLFQFGNAAATKTNPTSYLGTPYEGTPSGTVATPGIIVPAAGTLSGLVLRKSDDADADALFTVQKNGVDTTLLASISAHAFSGVDNTHTVALVAGDVIGVKLTFPGGAPSADLANVYAGMIFDLT